MIELIKNKKSPLWDITLIKRIIYKFFIKFHLIIE